ncbi:hypothetical protein DL96DRAFT_1630100 [Flagelloscypha sp. PMI_526]|nr:hypothetical protein DL96DRAFT_1630100 [Flagelloscypha sp. PMI_526]
MRLDEAETSLTLALNIFNGGIESRINEALTNRSFGDLHLLRGQFEDCEMAFRRALELDIATRSRAGQGQSHRGLGRMFMEKGDHAAAELSYSGALRLFLEIDDHQVDCCLIDLGKVWVQQGKIEKSEASDVEVLRARWNAEEKPLLSKLVDGATVST